MRASAENADDLSWRTFVRQFVSFCLNILMRTPKGHRKLLFMRFAVKYNLSDFPANTCLRDDCYQKLWNLTTSEFEGVVPVELISCIDAMIASPTPRDFELWMVNNYNEYHTPREIS
jgi:hypothetical protein